MEKFNKKALKACIFLISFGIGLQITGVVPILGVLNERYASQGTSTVQVLQTLPYILMMAGLLSVGPLSWHINMKKIAIAGFALIGVFGCMPFLSDSYVLLFTCRLLIGLGFGLIMPVIASILSAFFQPDERPACVGLQVVGIGVGAMMGNVIGGALAGIGTRYFYLVYALAFAAMVLLWVLLPKAPEEPNKEKKSMRGNMHFEVFILSFLSCLFTLLNTAYSTNIAIHVTRNITSSTSVSGFVTAVNACFAMLVGICFSRIVKKFTRWTLPFSILLSVLGFSSVLFVPGLVGVFLCSALCGAAESVFKAHTNFLLTLCTNIDNIATASGIYNVLASLGGLVSPIILGSLALLAKGSNTTSGQFLISLIGMSVLCVLSLLFVRKDKKEE